MGPINHDGTAGGRGSPASRALKRLQPGNSMPAGHTRPSDSSVFRPLHPLPFWCYNPALIKIPPEQPCTAAGAGETTHYGNKCASYPQLALR
jgi:hypothetical protein